jgi:hypothetical protein
MCDPRTLPKLKFVEENEEDETESSRKRPRFVVQSAEKLRVIAKHLDALCLVSLPDFEIDVNPEMTFRTNVTSEATAIFKISASQTYLDHGNLSIRCRFSCFLACTNKMKNGPTYCAPLFGNDTLFTL